MKNPWLGVRSMAMTVLFPGTVAGYIPYRIMAPAAIPGPREWSWTRYGATVIFGIGLAVLLWCIWDFARYGRGTLAPFDEPRKLVVQGLYRSVRNPMYLGVVLMLSGESWFFSSSVLWGYTALVFVAFNVFVLAYEEPRLRSKFGASYERYCRSVGRWVPGRPFRGLAGHSTQD